MRTSALFLFFVLSVCHSTVESRTVIITGATGRTGSSVYLSLKATPNVTVRGLVQNVTKAKEILKCDKCDASEGIFVGDITKPSTLTAAMAGADTLVITTGPGFHCVIPSIYVGCKYYPGADPKTISWLGVKNQVGAFANSTGAALAARHVILISNDLTTVPDNFLDKIGNGHGCFYGLNGEAFTMAAGMPWTVVKPNGLSLGPAASQEILVAHDDQGWSPTDPSTEFVTRADVARMLTYAALNPEATSGLRFDVTAKKTGGAPTKDISEVFASAMYPWDPRKSTMPRERVVPFLD